MIKYIAPATLKNPDSKQFITDVIKQIEEKRQITRVDFASLNMLVISYDSYLTASDILNQEGFTVLDSRSVMKSHPCISVVNKMFNQVITLLNQFELTNKSDKQNDKVEDKELTPLDKFFSKKQ